METNEIMEKIYAFESKKELYDFVFEDSKLPIWMFIRCSVVEKVVRKELGVSGIDSKGVPYDHSKGIVEYTYRNPFFINHKEIVYAFFSNELWKKDDKGRIYEERYFPYINYAKKKTTMLINFKCDNEFGLHCEYPNWRSDLLFRKYLDIKKKSTKNTPQIGKKFLSYLVENFPFKMEKQLCKTILEKINFCAITHLSAIQMCEVYLKVVNPKLVVIDCACYRELLNIAMLIACKNKKVVTAEFQHGFLGLVTAGPYLYGETTFKRKECKLFFPDYFLTMGKYWNSLVQIPSKCYVVGTSHLDKVNKNPNNNNILFTASNDYELYDRLLKQLLKYKDNEFTIYFRFHPREHSDKIFKKFGKYTRYENFKLANDENLIYYLNKCSYVISDGSSTVLEAVSVGRTVFVINNSLYKNYIKKFNDGCMYEFSNVTEFINLWEKRKELKNTCRDVFYDTGWERNYRAFLKKIGIRVNEQKN